MNMIDNRNFKGLSNFYAYENYTDRKFDVLETIEITGFIMKLFSIHIKNNLFSIRIKNQGIINFNCFLFLKNYYLLVNNRKSVFLITFKGVKK